MGRLKDLTGSTHGDLKVLRLSGRDSHGHTKWECLCSCGNICEVTRPNLLAQRKSKKCGNCVQNTYLLVGDTYICTVSSGGSFTFDAVDYTIVSEYKWYMCDRYPTARVGKLSLRLHILLMGNPDKGVIDHIDRDKTNNKRDNLRVTTYSLNVVNSNRTAGVSGHRGVSWNSRVNKWYVRVSIKGVGKNLGYFDKLEDAVAKRKEAELLYYGESSPKEVI